jgi:large subunit ribosomal protein L21
MKLAVIKTGGKQYLIKQGDKIRIEKIEGPASAKATAGKKDVNFTDVLLIADDKKVEIGTPVIKNAKVIGKILKQGRKEKVISFKYKPKKRYQKKAGHRQHFTEVEIKDILLSSQ